MDIKPTFKATAAASLLLIASISIYAQGNPVRWSIKKGPPPGILRSGDKFVIELLAQVDDGWHVYSITQPKGGPIVTSIGLSKVQPFKIVGMIKGPQPQSTFDGTLGINIELYEGSPIFKVPLQVTGSAEAGERKLLIEVRFQACNGDVCLLPKTVRLEAEVELATDGKKIGVRPAILRFSIPERQQAAKRKEVREQRGEVE